MEKIIYYINTKIFWNEEEGVWLDYDLLNDIQRNQFFVSNIAPLWANCWSSIVSPDTSVIERVLDYLDRSQVTQ